MMSLRPVSASPTLILLLAVGLVPLAATAGEPEARADFTGWYNGVPGFKDAIAEQKETGKPMLVYFYADWCGYCAQFEEVLLNEEPVIEYLAEIIKVRVNPEHGMAEREVANMYGVRGYPVLVMHSAKSKTMSRVSRYEESDGNARLLEGEAFVRKLKEAAEL